MATIKIYSTPWCTYCRMAKDFFKANNVNFTEYDVSVDEKARNEMLEKSKQSGVPVIDIDGELIIGFDKARVSSVLGIK
ncbi:MAG: glutaredoxin domain-containing protein [Patescibacteria group bacterium]